MMKLKPCPFCGDSHPECGRTDSEANYGAVAVMCQHCGATGSCFTGDFDYEELVQRAVAAWNIRGKVS